MKTSLLKNTMIFVLALLACDLALIGYAVLTIAK
jgi:hypothetical protein